MTERTVVVGSRVGLHARPASLFVQAASAQPVRVRIRKGDGPAVDTRSMLRVLALGAKGGEAVVLEADHDPRPNEPPRGGRPRRSRDRDRYRGPPSHSTNQSRAAPLAASKSAT